MGVSSRRPASLESGVGSAFRAHLGCVGARQWPLLHSYREASDQCPHPAARMAGSMEKPRTQQAWLITTRRPHPDFPRLRPSPPNPTADRESLCKLLPTHGWRVLREGRTECLGAEERAGSHRSSAFLHGSYAGLLWSRHAASTSG